MVSGDLADLLAMHVAQRLAGPTKAADRGDEVLRPFAGNLDAEEELECGVYVVDRLSLFRRAPEEDRKSVVKGQSVSVRVDRGGRRIIKKKNITIAYHIDNELRA